MENENMDMFTAIAIAEGMQDADDDGMIEAYQFLVDTGLAWIETGNLWAHSERPDRCRSGRVQLNF